MVGKCIGGLVIDKVNLDEDRILGKNMMQSLSSQKISVSSIREQQKNEVDFEDNLGTNCNVVNTVDSSNGCKKTIRRIVLRRKIDNKEISIQDEKNHKKSIKTSHFHQDRSQIQKSRFINNSIINNEEQHSKFKFNIDIKNKKNLPQKSRLYYLTPNFQKNQGRL